ncbi:carbohydrate-binding module family 13 protein [Venturia nashicola]|uniref:Alpha-galactosidase n=1 Tax=Venturia nashicola TaxID=86259 RepID=A0A4Z1NH22_9PEZI|nr:carbohydrate-binding module family 13 protein [Venturia nashicola]TLD21013.1 carbohydrate-binding module family 13 protein [Venturia nashicola]
MFEKTSIHPPQPPSKEDATRGPRLRRMRPVAIFILIVAIVNSALKLSPLYRRVAISLYSPDVASIDAPSILPTPPMGFNNWARFQCALNESLFTKTADAMVSKGLLAAGYNRINIDDCWLQHERAPNGSLQWNTTLFPHGIPWLADYVNSRGFHLGIYQDSGNKTCGGYPGSEGYEEIDAHTFADWGIDYLKLDGCNIHPKAGRTMLEENKNLNEKWYSVLSEMETRLVFSQSAPAYFSGPLAYTSKTNRTNWNLAMEFVPVYGELARHSHDIDVYGDYNSTRWWDSILNNFGFEVLLARYQQPGFYNDPDFLIVDWPWLTINEKRSQFALWASFSAPLLISAYIPDLTDDEIAYLTNSDIIAINQDPLALQATLVSQDGTWDVLTKSLANGDRLLTVLNRGNDTGSTIIDVERMGLEKNREFVAKDLWSGNILPLQNEINVTLDGHATGIYRLSGVGRVMPSGMIFNTASKRCLTASNTAIVFEECNAADSQVWRVSPVGLISPVSAPLLCLSSTGLALILNDCEEEDSQQRWLYHVSGNVLNLATKKCLVETQRRGAIESCGPHLDSQIFGLPSGVVVLR